MERAVLQRLVDPGQVLVDDAARADVEVADLGIPLLAFGQPDRLAGSRERRMRPPPPQGVPIRRLRRRDRVAEWLGAVAPTVDDHQKQRGPGRAYTRGDWTT